MKNEEIIRKAIGEAEKNGWKCESINNIINIFSHNFAEAFWGNAEVCQFCGSDDIIRYGDEYCGYKKCENNDCDFDVECTDENYILAITAWKYHLQQLVLEKDPIKYLEKFIS